VEFIFTDIYKEKLDICFDDLTILIHLAWEGLPYYDKTYHYEKNLPNNSKIFELFSY